MNREALLLYLRNVRDLEVSRYWLRVRFQREKGNKDNQRASLLKTNYCAMPNELKKNDYFGCCFWFCVVFALLGIILIMGMMIMEDYHDADDAGFIVSVTVLGIMGFGGVAIAILSSYKNDKDVYLLESKATEEHNRKEKLREVKNLAVLSELETSWNSRCAWYKQENQKLDNLLNDFYNMNILATQYRSLSAVCYIYDYMSTSQATLEDTLVHEHMEDGIRRLEEKLDCVISKIEDVVYETRCIRQNSEQMMVQNNHMLDSLQRAEENTLQAAQYAQLSANYNKANAYFSLATYLKNQEN